MFRLMLVNVSLLLLQFEKCIANDICDAAAVSQVGFESRWRSSGRGGAEGRGV